jgi:uncharacterized repeat protein (TIGR03803 family)
MTTPVQLATLIFRSGLRARAFAVALLCALTAILTQPMQAQALTVLHYFTGGADGAYPDAGLTMDMAGNLYGTTFGDGYSNSNGSVYKLTHTNGGWVFAPLYTFRGGNDGGLPYAGVVFGPDGSLYGTTTAGGAHGQGTVFNLKPSPHFSPNIFAPWIETVLYSFQGGVDGSQPYGSVTFDPAGNIYGSTYAGGSGGSGTVYKMIPSGDGHWTESVIYSFSNSDGWIPVSSLTLDNAGNLYGTTLEGGAYGAGTVYELTYSAGSGWAESFLYSFNSNHGGVANPYVGLIFDPSGNLYGATADGAGGIFKLTPSDGSWTYSLLYGTGGGIEACGARGNLVMDGAGNLYGTTFCDGAYGQGSVFKLRLGSILTYTMVYSFTGDSDGYWPSSNVVFDASGKIYGTTFAGGPYGDGGYGVVWEITP